MAKRKKLFFSLKTYLKFARDVKILQSPHTTLDKYIERYKVKINCSPSYRVTVKNKILAFYSMLFGF